jgi:glutamate-ammonia-ligase adenylyltransferase
MAETAYLRPSRGDGIRLIKIAACITQVKDSSLSTQNRPRTTMNRLTQIADTAFAPKAVLQALESLFEPSVGIEDEPDACSDSFLCSLGNLLAISPPMLDTLRLHPEYLGWLRVISEQGINEPDKILSHGEPVYYQRQYKSWSKAAEGIEDEFERLRIFKRREYLRISFLDIAGILSFEETVSSLSALADWLINEALGLCWEILFRQNSVRGESSFPKEGLAVIAMGKLGGEELNYSSDVDLVFCRRNPESAKEQNFFSKLGERLVQELSKVRPEGFLYRVDMRLRPHGAAGPLVPTIDSIINYYESWGETWERQALIKARFIAGAEPIGRRFQEFAAAFTFSRQLDESALEDIKRIKHRAEREYAIEPRIHLKQGPGGIRDIEFYVQFSQLTIGWKFPEVRTGNTLSAIAALARMKVLLDGEERALSMAYAFLRIVEHRLQLRALTPQAVLPEDLKEIEMLARSLGFGDHIDSAAEAFAKTLENYRSQVREILERVYLSPGYLRLNEREEELAQLLSERTPKQRVHELLSQYGFQDIDRAWQNIRLLALGPAGRLLPPSERRAFLEFAFPMLEVIRDTVDPDQALHNLEDFATATGNRVSFLRTLASRRPHLSRLTNLLAISNLCRNILSRHPEYFDSLARGMYLHEGRQTEEMYLELQERRTESPRGEEQHDILRRYRQREMVRIAYRDLAGLADSLEVSRELSDLASACLQAVVDWTHPSAEDITSGASDSLHLIAMGKLGSRQLHYSSDLDMIFLYDSMPEGTEPDLRARLQKEQDERVEKILEILAMVTPEGTAYPIDLRLRPGGAAGLLARSWESFYEYSRRYMQPWERMALVRSRIVYPEKLQSRWDSLLSAVVYEHVWSDDDFESIRHIKRRIEAEKSKESRVHLDFKYGKGGIADLEFLVQFLQIKHGAKHPEIRSPGLKDAVYGLCEAEILDQKERDILISANQFQRLVENRHQLMEEWTSREISRESPQLARLAASLGYRRDAFHARKSFLSDWDNTVRSVRQLVEKYFYRC